MIHTPLLRHTLEEVKAIGLCLGVDIDPNVLNQFGGEASLTVREYATTAGIPLRIGDVYMNLPFAETYTSASPIRLTVIDSEVVLTYAGQQLLVDEIFPLPGYLERPLASGLHASDLIMSHMDRFRVSPISGCAYDCSFCDLGTLRYSRRTLDECLEAIDIAVADRRLPVRHGLVSGGSPGRAHEQWFNELVVEIVRRSPVPVDVMFSASRSAPSFVESLVAAGVNDLSINIEVFEESSSSLHLRNKHRFSRPHLDETLRTAVELMGESGAVRSLIILGLEPVQSTLEGIEYLASVGVEPVLSPFRPAQGTALEAMKPIDPDSALHILSESRKLAAAHGLRLGPSCAPCQHNTLTFPWDRS